MKDICQYATIGCNHAIGCIKKFYRFEKKKCGYYLYFKFLDEFCKAKHDADSLRDRRGS